MGPAGFEHPPLTPAKTPISASGGAESDARFVCKPDFEPDLAKVVRAWPNLSQHIKVAIKALVDSARTEER